MRRGSALLIVLGMVAFMVVSAVGFAVYMRESRLPSSFLRRESTARYLLKSALANAIARLDGEMANNGHLEGVYDDVYPGLTREDIPVNQNGNYWSHRVFTPFGQVSPDETVSTLTLEGLAYLPPAVINEARIFSRMTRTASWSNLSYDLGRYAFCAIDVSDCFDINKVSAGERRTSAPNQRVNLLPLYPENGEDLDDLLDKVGDQPFVSIADYNIVAGSSPFSPFYKYIGTSGSKIYNASDFKAVSNAIFVTDTWFPATNATFDVDFKPQPATTAAKTYDLAGGEDGQPFKDYDANSFMDPLEGQTRFMSEVVVRNLGTPGVACLYDYLDKDSEPLSLCLPCVETAPMVCGLGFTPGEDFILRKNTTKTLNGTHEIAGRVDSSGQPAKEKVKMTQYALEIPDMQLPVKALVAFPFKRTELDGKKTGGYKFKFVARLFFAPDKINSRIDPKTPIRPDTPSDWTDGYKDGVLTIPCEFRGSIAKQEKGQKMTTDQTLTELTGQLNIPAQTLPMFWMVEKSLLSGTGSPTSPQQYYSIDGIKNDQNRLQIFDAQGKVSDWAKDLNAKDNLPADGGTWADADLPEVAKNDVSADLCALEVIPHLAVWMLVEKDGKAVDLVPACPKDDVSYGNHDSVAQEAGEIGGFCGGATQPILEFCGEESKKFKISLNGLGSLDGQPDPFQWSQLFAVDPRFNFAPENWFAVKGYINLKQNWKSSVVDNYLGKEGRDKDVFMFTSDQEYLQSVGELQFLPFLQELNGKAAGFECTYKAGVNYSGRPMVERILEAGQSPDTLSDKLGAQKFFWRTYGAFGRGGGLCNPFYLRNAAGQAVSVVSGEGSFRANPFSRDPRIMTAVVGDTPYDYHIASTNAGCNTNAKMSGTDSLKMAFCPEGESEKWDAQDVAEIGAELRAAFGDAFRQDGVTDITRIMSGYLSWEKDAEKNDNQRNFLGIEMADPLHGVDRKFLYSFWHDCLQNRQQLFLVFIRAEPLTVGGSSGDAIANSQLGARGVALVWRDPAPPPGGTRRQRTGITSRSTWRAQSEQSGPHRTRVLFYHQFD